MNTQERDKFNKQVDRELGVKKRDKSPASCALLNIFQKAAAAAESMDVPNKREMYYLPGPVYFKVEFLGAVRIMENAVGLAEKVNEEVVEMADNMKQLLNELRGTYDVLGPELLNMVRELRNSRMTVTTELQQSLKIMKEVRSFFLESDYKHEMERLEAFVGLAERLKALIHDGTLDAVCDAALKLAVGPE
jgi:hypothetical protein